VSELAWFDEVDEGSAQDDRELAEPVRSVLPVLEQEAASNDQLRRLTGPAAAALQGSGLFRLATPRVLGGHESSLSGAVRVCAALARRCASSSWLVGIFFGGARYAAQFPDDVRREIWGSDPDTVVCGSVRPHGKARFTEEGVVLTGRWPWTSGIRLASWVLLGLESASPDGGTDRMLALIPASEVAVEDSGFVAGMRATGSETVIVDELFVPARKLLSYREMADGLGRRRHPDEPRVTIPMSINLPLVGTVIGLAEGVQAQVRRSLIASPRRRSPLHGVAADEPAGCGQPEREVAFAEEESGVAVAQPAEVVGQALTALVSPFGFLRQQPHRDVGQRARHARVDLRGRHRHPSQMIMDEA